MTSIIKVDFKELLQLYSYVLPNILFFTIPISFFAAATISLTKLSLDYELIVLFSLGFSPNKIINIFLRVATLVTFSLLALSLGLIPLTYQLNKEFIYEKRSNASLNIKATEFGQKFGDWLVFIGNSTDGEYIDIAMFSNKNSIKAIESNETFIISKSAKVENINGDITLSLFDGKGFLVSDEKISQIDFEKMSINDISKLQTFDFNNVFNYWADGISKGDKKIIKSFSLYIFISIFPVLSIFLIVAFGILNPRYDKNHSYLYIILSIVLYYVLIYNLAKTLPFIGLILLPPIWIISSYYIYKKRVERF
jgi:lipopolysaccharide export system permease protein